MFGPAGEIIIKPAVSNQKATKTLSVRWRKHFQDILTILF